MVPLAATKGERVFLFTLHKCASTLLHRAGLACATARGMRYVSPHPGGVRISLKELAADPTRMAEPGCYGPIRIPIDVPDPADTKVVLHLRDPRDALVSMFYSYCYSHPGEVPGGTGYRQAVADRGIDEFVLAMATSGSSPVSGDYGTGAHLWAEAGNYRDRCQRYVDSLVGHPGVTVIRYEDMVTDFETWLAALVGVFGLPTSHPAVQELAAVEAPASREPGENPWSHRRRVTPGDHRNKLSPDTIARLNDVFADCLEALGYV